mmetsp:Transcript_26868/g.44916  ORF Transcript_26868/g.44916 Transcript_26868/m.44916 type:complete len:513 (-) Transcript_26868:358-1896(-)
MGNKASSSSSSEDISDRTENDGANGSNPGHRHTIESDTNVDEPEAPSQSYYSMIKQSYQALVHAIIRPPRCEYDYHQLGPKNFEFGQRRFVRNDFTLRNLRGQQICCSLWEPIGSHRPSPMLPCVIYMHGNSSARLEALSSLSLVLSLGATMLAFDFSGSGLSEGEYVSLGYYEKDDLQCVIEHLRGGGTTSTIALWGRSMGAATALLHGERDPSIASMVLDSAFASLVQLAEEMVEMGRQQGLFAPGILVRLVLSFVRGSVQRAAQFDIRALRPIESADKCFIPAMFVAAENDHFVSQQHSVLLHDKYGGDKNLVIVDGDHNTPRPRFLYDSIGIFLSSTLQIPEEWMLVDCEVFMRRVPWAAVPPSFAAAPSFFSTSTTSRPPAPASTTTTMNASSTTSSSTNNSNRNRRRRNGGSGADDAGAMGDDDAAQAYMEAYRRASELNNMYQQQQQQQQKYRRQPPSQQHQQQAGGMSTPYYYSTANGTRQLAPDFVPLHLQQQQQQQNQILLR